MEEPIFTYGDVQFKAKKEFIFGIFSAIIVMPIIFFIGLAVLSFFPESWYSVLYYIWIIAAIVLTVALFASTISDYKGKKNVPFKHMLELRKDGAVVSGNQYKWADIRRIIVQAGREENKVVYRKRFHHLVNFELKDGKNIPMIAESDELLKGFNFDGFIAAIVQLKKEKLLSGLRETDHAMITKAINSAKKK